MARRFWIITGSRSQERVDKIPNNYNLLKGIRNSQKESNPLSESKPGISEPGI